MKKLLFGFFGVFLCAQAYSANFPTGAQIEVISDFSGGLNTTSPRHKIPKNFSPNMLNVNISRVPGQVNKRAGFVLAGSTFTLQNGRLMFTFTHEDGGKEFIVSDDSVVLTTKDFKTYTFISSGLNNSVHLCAIQARNKIWFSNGINSVFTWDINGVKQILDGTIGTPNVPKFRYLVYYQERVFGFNTSANASQLQWSALSSTSGAAIAPDSFLAWPFSNALNIGQGDGTSGTSEWLYRGQLQLGKERSIYTLYGTNDSTYFARKTEAQAGVSSNESVVLLDGFTYYKGYDGIYAYDGQTSKRISDAIIPNIAAINDSANLIIDNAWETQQDFLRGNFQYGTTVTASGLLQVPGSSVTPNVNYSTHTGSALEGGEAASQFIRLSQGQSTNFVVRVPSESFPSNFNGYAYIISFFGRCLPSTCGNLKFTLTNNRTGASRAVTANNPFGNGFGSTLELWGNETVFSPKDTVMFTGDDVKNGNMQYKLEYTGTGDVYEIFPASTTGFSTWQMLAGLVGQYVSEISTLAMVTSWGTFDSVNQTNGGSINYYFRSSTSLVNIATKTWAQITPGVVIGDPIINNFIQWGTTITMVNPLTPPLIDNVTITHIEGSGARDRPFAIDWKNEYWLSVATETTGLFSIQYVKSLITNDNPIAWQPYQGINVRSFCKDGTNTLYGGSASTGAFYRLDYGTNDNGVAIDGFYETPNLSLKGALSGSADGNWMEDSIHELWFDSDPETSNTTTLGMSVNGSAYVDTGISLTGTMRILKTLYNQNKFGKYFGLRVRNNQLDKGLFLNALAVIYEPLQTR